MISVVQFSIREFIERILPLFMPGAILFASVWSGYWYYVRYRSKRLASTEVHVVVITNVATCLTLSALCISVGLLFGVFDGFVPMVGVLLGLGPGIVILTSIAWIAWLVRYGVTALHIALAILAFGVSASALLLAAIIAHS